MSEVGKEHGVAWWTVHRMLVAAAADVLGPVSEPTTTIGIDETRARSIRWLLVAGELTDLVAANTAAAAWCAQVNQRGRKLDPAWAHHRLLLRAGDTLSPQALARLKTVFAIDDPSGHFSRAWVVKELLRQLLQAHGPTRNSRHGTAPASSPGLSVRLRAGHG